ncbi:smr protein/Muts2-like [Iodidimonas gelatinilytica]|uniref:Smr protein/Muts2-like n=1 Tax=Iodidimonas gelatinilytica TaxID=1236966 RepID=A0A5A7MNQ7_9PROT|nr:Smr/MutS family protein [Iodidimonas gelatinilytica]GEQ97486.1 smr protein/Muts2-like [Iodidimonas gelatinilytica]GER01611.1 smr protein/Muts2-like [Iodidimonas gelatinilytica]
MTRRRKNYISSDDQKLWDSITRDVRPLKDRPAAPPLPKNSHPGKGAARAVEDVFSQHMSAFGYDAKPQEMGPPAALVSPALDRRQQRKLARGHKPIDSRIDLHGLTQQKAFTRLCGHIASAVSRGERAVLVITGKGGRHRAQSGDDPVAFRRRDSFDLGSGVLKRMVPIWLESPQLSALVHSYGPAHDTHGGDGALYVLLRRRR